MSTPAQSRDDRTINALLLAVLFISGLMLLREGPHFDNVVDGWPFFTGAFFIGALLGFLGWSYTFGSAPMLKFSGSYRRPWLAALIMGLLTAVSVSYINRIFAAPPDRTVTTPIESIEEGRAGRWRLMVKMSDGRYQRYLIPDDAALALKTAKTVRIGIARGALGFDLMAKFEPQT